MYRQFVLIPILLAFSPHVNAQTDSPNSPCPMPFQQIASVNDVTTLDVIDEEFSPSFEVGSKTIVVCPSDEHIKASNITDETNIDISCTRMKNETDGGVGYAPEGYDTAHIWFFVDPNSDAKLVEIGIYRANIEQSWFVTDISCP